MFSQAHGPYARRPSPVVPILTAVGAVVSTALCVIAVRRQRSGSGGSSAEEVAQLKRVLAELCRQFFHVCREVARVARNVRTQLAKTNVAVADSTLQTQLQQQCKVLEKLAEIEADVMGRFGTTPAQVQRLQERSRDPEVRAYVEGMKEMLSDALLGLPPVLPNVQIPAELTEEKVLDMQRQMQILECKSVLDKMGSKRCSAKDFEKMLVLVQKESMEAVFKEHGLLRAGGMETYHSAEAMYMRMPEFERDKQKLDAQHQQNMVALFQPLQRGENPSTG